MRSSMENSPQESPTTRPPGTSSPRTREAAVAEAGTMRAGRGAGRAILERCMCGLLLLPNLAPPLDHFIKQPLVVRRRELLVGTPEQAHQLVDGERGEAAAGGVQEGRHQLSASTLTPYPAPRFRSYPPHARLLG